jgi:hypothetical protein
MYINSLIKKLGRGPHPSQLPKKRERTEGVTSCNTLKFMNLQTIFEFKINLVSNPKFK